MNTSSLSTTGYYDPLTGRFIGRDPIGYKDGMALYAAYFPPNGVDPDGGEVYKCSCITGWILAGEFLEPHYTTSYSDSPCGANCKSLPLTPDESKANNCCNGDSDCEAALAKILNQIKGTPKQPRWIPYPPNKCFNWLDDFLKNYPEYNGNPISTGGGITLTPFDVRTFGDELLVTSRNRLGLPTGSMSGHGVVEMTITPKSGKGCTVHFDLGSSTTQGHYGGDDHLFFPDETGFELEMDMNLRKPYIPGK